MLDTKRDRDVHLPVKEVVWSQNNSSTLETRISKGLFYGKTCNTMRKEENREFVRTKFKVIQDVSRFFYYLILVVRTFVVFHDLRTLALTETLIYTCRNRVKSRPE